MSFWLRLCIEGRAIFSCSVDALFHFDWRLWDW